MALVIFAADSSGVFRHHTRAKRLGFIRRYCMRAADASSPILEIADAAQRNVKKKQQQQQKHTTSHLKELVRMHLGPM